MSELEHHYGPRVHVSDNPWLAGALARFSAPATPYLELIPLLRVVYQTLAAEALGRVLPAVEARMPTRMAEQHPEAGVWSGRVPDPASRVVVVDVMRGGILPAQLCFELLLAALPLEAVRQDHLNMARRSDGEGRVVGVDLTGSKIGGSVEGATLVVPDPMGATGSTMIQTVEHYLEHHGRPARILAMPLISTPEFLRRVLDHPSEMTVSTARVDRGLSPPDVLSSAPGEHWERERGLDDNSYIVPGAGGVGEVLNNSWC